MHPTEAFLTLASLGLLTRMREIAKCSIPPGHLRVGKKELRPEDLVISGDPVKMSSLLTELADMGHITLSFQEGRRQVLVTEYLEEGVDPSPVVGASETVLRSDGYREWAEAYQPTHEWNCPAMWDSCIAAGWAPQRIVGVARWYSTECAKKNAKRMRSSEFFRRLPELEKQYLASTREERDGDAIWKQEVLDMFRKKQEPSRKANAA